MSDAPYDELSTNEDWKNALDHSDQTPVLVFKHSSSCSISGKADSEIVEFAQEEDVPVYRVVVQDSRAVSDVIEKELGVRHETPQVILLHEGTSVFNTSHFNVTADTLREELRRLPLSNS